MEDKDLPPEDLQYNIFIQEAKLNRLQLRLAKEKGKLRRNIRNRIRTAKKNIKRLKMLKLLEGG